MDIKDDPDFQDYKEIMKNDALARRYWAIHTQHLIGLAKVQNDFIRKLSKMCDRREAMDPIAVKMMIKQMWKKKAKLAKDVKFGKDALE